MKRALFALLIILGLLLLSAKPSQAATSQPKPDQIYVLAGQSNMLGRGMPLSLGELPSPHIWKLYKLKWITAVDPLGDPKKKDNGIGPGMTFGLYVLATNPDKNIGLVQCAVGATSMDDWQPKHSLYKNCMKQVKAAKIPVAAILFLQGESDAETKKLANHWEAGFANLYAAFKKDMGGQFLLGQIGNIDAKKFKYQQIVRDQQFKAATDYKLPMIVTLDLPVGQDKVHFTVESYKIIGQRFAAALGY